MKKALLLVLLCVFIFVAALIYQILQERKLLVRTREQAEVARRELLVTRAENGRLVGELFRQKIDSMDILCSETFLNGNETCRKDFVYNAFKKELRSFRTPGQRFRALEEALNRYENGAVERVRELFPKCKEYQIRRLCLFFAGLSYPSICFITGDSVDSLKVSKSRYRKLFRALDSETGEFLAALLDGPEAAFRNRTEFKDRPGIMDNGGKQKRRRA